MQEQPMLWTCDDVLEWLRPRFSEATLHQIKTNQVDGATFLSLTQDDIRDELRIAALRERRCLWEQVEKMRSVSKLLDLRFGLGLLSEQIEEALEHAGQPAFHKDGLFDEVALRALKSDCSFAKQSVADSLLVREEDAKIFLSDRDDDKEIAEALDLDCSAQRAQEMMDHVMALQFSGNANESELRCALAKSALSDFNIEPLQAIGASYVVLQDIIRRELNGVQLGVPIPSCDCRNACSSTCQCTCSVHVAVEAQQHPNMSSAFTIFSVPGQIVGLDGFVGKADVSLDLADWSEDHCQYMPAEEFAITPDDAVQLRAQGGDGAQVGIRHLLDLDADALTALTAIPRVPQPSVHADRQDGDHHSIVDSMARTALSEQTGMMGAVAFHDAIIQPGHTTAARGLHDALRDEARLTDAEEVGDRHESFCNEHICSCCGVRGPAYEAPCDHPYCVACLRQLLLKAILEPRLLPVRCCGVDFDQNVAKIVLASADLDRFQMAWVEISAVSKMYCPVNTCSQFINLDFVDAAEFPCPRCGVGLCKECRAGAHEGMSCAQFQETEQGQSSSEEQRLIELGRQLGWQQCTRCGSLVELATGCNHMTCRCGGEFCYTCGVEWKNENESRLCTCPMFTEEHLLLEGHRRAEVIAQQQGINPIINPAPFAVVVQREIQRLSSHQECGRDCTWSRQEGYGGNCEHCGFMMNCYHYFCRGHESRICYVCVHHRIGGDSESEWDSY